MPAMIYYEQPLNERIRTMLRMELLFKQMRHHAQGNSSWDNRSLINTLMDILEILSRADFKSELLKELERALTMMEKLMSNPGVDHSRLQTLLKALESLIASLHRKKESPGQQLREDTLLNSIRQRGTIPGGTCDFDLPLYHFWLNQDADKREADIKRWLNHLEPLRQSIDLLLKLLRNSSDPNQVTAENGIYQQNLEANQNHQLIRVGLSKETNCFAEISGGKHRITVRLLEPQQSGRPLLSSDNINFNLILCVL